VEWKKREKKNVTDNAKVRNKTRGKKSEEGRNRSRQTLGKLSGGEGLDLKLPYKPGTSWRHRQCIRKTQKLPQYSKEKEQKLGGVDQEKSKDEKKKPPRNSVFPSGTLKKCKEREKMVCKKRPEGGGELNPKHEKKKANRAQSAPDKGPKVELIQGG